MFWNDSAKAIKENIHHFRVHFREQKRELRSIFNIDCGIGVQIAVAGFDFAHRLHASATKYPADTRLQSESRLVEEKHIDPFTGVSDFGYLCGEFF